MTIVTYILAAILVLMALGVVYVIGNQDGKIYKVTTALYAVVFLASAGLLIHQQREIANLPDITNTCIDKAELPTGQPYIGMSGVYATFFETEDGDTVVVKICD